MKFSVVISAYKRPELLELCLQNVKTFRQIEQVVVVENVGGGSFCEEVCRRQSVERIPVDFGESFAAGACFSLGSQQAKEEITLFCDQDSLFPARYFDGLEEIHGKWDNLLAFTAIYRLRTVFPQDILGRHQRDGAEWSTGDDIKPLWHFIYVDGNASIRTKWLRQATWSDSLREYGGQYPDFAYRLANSVGIVPCLFETPYYFHIEHEKLDPCYTHKGEPEQRIEQDIWKLKDTLAPVRRGNPSDA